LQPLRLPNALRETLQRSEKTAAIVLEVAPEGPAQKAGIAIGDVIVSLGGSPVTRLEDIQAILAGDAIGKTLTVKFIRGGALQEASIVAEERPAGRE
jgi:S1-C subfamily serine protease